jgi:PKD repeat protein
MAETFGFVTQVSGLRVSFRIIGKVPVLTPVNWDFGDNGTEFNVRNPQHEYEQSGIYTVICSYTDADGETQSYSADIVVNTLAHTHLTGSIYNLIDAYIPEELATEMAIKDKQVFINKWQLYIHPLVNHHIPLEEYSNELYYEGLENQLIMELAVWDYLNTWLYNILARTGAFLSNIATLSEEADDNSVHSRGDRIKQITTGPTEVQYYDKISESYASLYSTYYKALQPGGVIDSIKKNLCMLAERLEIFLPICNRVGEKVTPKVTNHRVTHKLDGPNPTYPILGGDNTLFK